MIARGSQLGHGEDDGEMKATRHRNQAGNGGFTLPEVLITTAIVGIVTAGVYRVFIGTLLETKAGTSQAVYIDWGRRAASRIMRYVEQGQSVTVPNPHKMLITSIDISVYPPVTTVATLEFTDADSDPSTLADNALTYDPDTSVSGDERTVCTHVTPIAGTPMFKVYAAAPQSVLVRFHVGDASPSEPRYYESGPGYQGLEIRFAATPRDIHQQWQL